MVLAVDSVSQLWNVQLDEYTGAVCWCLAAPALQLPCCLYGTQSVKHLLLDRACLDNLNKPLYFRFAVESIYAVPPEIITHSCFDLCMACLELFAPQQTRCLPSTFLGWSLLCWLLRLGFPWRTPLWLWSWALLCLTTVLRHRGWQRLPKETSQGI